MSGRGATTRAMKDNRSLPILDQVAWPAAFGGGAPGVVSLRFRASSKGTVAIELDMLIEGGVLTATSLDIAVEVSNTANQNENLPPPEHTFGPKAFLRDTVLAAPFTLLRGGPEIIRLVVAEFEVAPFIKDVPIVGGGTEERLRISLPPFLVQDTHWLRIFPRAVGGNATGIIRLMGGMQV